MNPSLSARSIREAVGRLPEAHARFARHYPGESGRRQPVHTVYGGAHLFKADSSRRLGELALRSLTEFAPDFITFAKAIDLPGSCELPVFPAQAAALVARLEANADASKKENRAAWLASAIYSRVQEKLRREPVEDFRIDFEDGYGNRPDAEEDGHAEAAAAGVAAGMTAGTLPPFLGIRIKPFSEELRSRSIRTLDLFLTTLVRRTRGKLPANFVVTLPKVLIAEEVATLEKLLGKFERALRLPAGVLKLELMIETTQSLFNEKGQANLLYLVEAARGRCVAAHFGTYDYTAACRITAGHQKMTHPACDFAKHVMQAALAGTGIWLSDGATNILPVAPHRASPDAPALTPAQIEENRKSIHRAWKLHYDHVQHSLVNGFYQGWDLHPAQLPTRYAAVYTFFLESLDAASERLRNFMNKAAQATLAGEVFDDAATGQGLLNYFLRAINCGAIIEKEALPLTSLKPAELRLGSFAKILKERRKQ